MLHVKYAIQDAEYFDGKEKLTQLCEETRMNSIPLNLAVIDVIEVSRYAIEDIVDKYKSMKDEIDKFRSGWSYRYNKKFIEVTGDYLKQISSRLDRLTSMINDCYQKTNARHGDWRKVTTGVHFTERTD